MKQIIPRTRPHGMFRIIDTGTESLPPSFDNLQHLQLLEDIKCKIVQPSSLLTDTNLQSPLWQLSIPASITMAKENGMSKSNHVNHPRSHVQPIDARTSVVASCYVVDARSTALQGFHYSTTGAGGEWRKCRQTNDSLMQIVAGVGWCP